MAVAAPVAPRRGLLAGLLLLLGLAGCGGHGGGSTATTGGTTAVQLKTPLLTFVKEATAEQADAVPVKGATPLELSITRTVLREAGAEPNGIGELRFSGKDGHRKLQLETSGEDAMSVRHAIGLTVGEQILGRLRTAGHPVETFATPEGSGDAPDGRDARGATLDGIASEVAQLANDTGTPITSIRVYPLGLIVVTSRYTDEELLQAKGTSLFVPLLGERVAAVFVRAEAPDGVAMVQGGSTYGVGVCYDGCERRTATAPAPPLPAELTGPTKLVVHYTGPARGDKVPKEAEVTLDCDTPTASSTEIDDPAGLCDDVLARRYALLSLLPLDATCSGLAGQSQVTVKGTVGGIAIDRGYGSCEGIARQWRRVLAPHLQAI